MSNGSNSIKVTLPPLPYLKKNSKACAAEHDLILLFLFVNHFAIVAEFLTTVVILSMLTN
jgi:hypothetical protein